ncbi:MAG: polyprenyl synthetase family protein [Opitutales bacterium]
MNQDSVSAPARPEGIAAVTAPIEADLRRLEAYLRREVSAFEPEVQPLVDYTLGHSGKKIRPILVFYGGWRPDEPASEELVRAGAVVEMVHLATLVHDDILDDAAMRHRMPTVTAEHGPDVAVLLGDALFAHALKLAADFPTVEVCRSVARATRQVCCGEIAQSFARGETRLSLEAYYRMIDLKTAELFAVSARLGAYLRGGPPAFVEAVERFARDLGIAYQLYDDVADFLGREEATGKTLGTDLESGKFTLPVLLFLDALVPSDAAQWRARLRDGTADPSRLLAAMQAEEVLPRVREAFVARLAAARHHLAPFADAEPAVGQLDRLARYVEGAMERYIPA